jgi:hypothetical protein
MDPSWEGDDPAAVVAEEETAPPTGESAPTPQATLPVASIVKGEYSCRSRRNFESSHSRMLTDTLVFLLIGAEAEGDDIPAAVPMENLTPETQEAAGGAPEPMEMAAGGAATATGGEEAATLPEPALEVVVRSQRSKTRSPSALHR